MSNATEDDLQQHLTQQRADLDQAMRDGRERTLALMGHKGLLGSGACYKACAAEAETTLDTHMREVIGYIETWPGANLTPDRAREIVTDHLKAAVDTLLTHDIVYRIGSRGNSADAMAQTEANLEALKARTGARLRAFELGVAKRAQPTTVNIVHARDILGGVQQAGGDAVQKNTVNLSAEAIGAALDHLLGQVKATSEEVAAEIEPDALTIRSQLTKGAPNGTIVQEAGRSIRTIIEGGVGGALGNAMSPGIVKALALLTAAIGLG